MGGDPGQDIGKPSLRIDVVHLGRDDQAVHGSGAMTTTIGTTEHPGPAPKSDASKRAFGGIVRQAHTPVVKEQGEGGPTLQDVIDRLGEIVTSGELGTLLAHVGLKFFDQAACSVPGEPPAGLPRSCR